MGSRQRRRHPARSSVSLALLPPEVQVAEAAILDFNPQIASVENTPVLSICQYGFSGLATACLLGVYGLKMISTQVRLGSGSRQAGMVYVM